jgi:hypothetical protein
MAEEAVKLKITERDDIADLLGLIPTWIISAVVWFAFTKLVLDQLSPKKPGTEINLAIIAGDFLPDWISDSPADLPPGVKIAALIDVTLAALDIGLPDPKELLLGQPLTAGTGAALWEKVWIPFWLIVSGGGKFGK